MTVHVDLGPPESAHSLASVGMQSWRLPPIIEVSEVTVSPRYWMFRAAALFYPGRQAPRSLLYRREAGPAAIGASLSAAIKEIYYVLVTYAGSKRLSQSIDVVISPRHHRWVEVGRGARGASFLLARPTAWARG